MKNRIFLTLVFSIFSLVSFGQNVGLQWVKGIGGSGLDLISSSVTDSHGNIYSVGGFNDTVDFDPGPGVFNLIDHNPGSLYKSLFLLKTDSAGNFLWAKTTRGVIGYAQIKIDYNYNIIISGSFSDSMDFDFGSPNYTIIAHTYANASYSSLDCFVLKMDSVGVFKWVKIFGGNKNENITKVLIDNQNNIINLGVFELSTVDFDPGTGVFNLSASTTETFIQKLDSNGNFVWVKQFGIVLYYSHSISIDNNSNIYFTGPFQGLVDFDPSTSSTYFLGSSGSSSSFFCKLNSSGGFVWAKKIYSTDVRLHHSITDSNGNLYATGSFKGIMDFDPGAGTHMDTSQIRSNGSYRASLFSIKLNDSGIFQWANVLYDPNSVFGSNIVLSPTGNLFINARNNIQKVDSLGNTIWVENILNYGNFLNVTSNDNIFLYGSYIQGYDFAPGQRVHTILNKGSSDMYWLKLAPCTPDTLISTDTISACGSYTWVNGVTYYTDTTLTYPFGNQSGCDSIGGLHLTLTPNDTTFQSFARCDSLLWIDGNVYRNSTIAHHVVSGVLANGCDSVYTLNLTITRDDSIAHVSTCDSLAWIDGTTYTASNNTAFVTYTNALGCDSTIWLDLFIPVGITTIDTVTACASYTWVNGISYTANNNTAIDTLTSSLGCDSIVTLDLTILNPTTSTDTINACYSYTWINGTTYNSNNTTATHTLINAAGCDSVVTLNLTVNTFAYRTITIRDCDSLVWTNGITYYNTVFGVYDTLYGGAATGCDSIVIMSFIKSTNHATDVINTCNSYTWINGTTYTSSNSTDSVTYTNTYGCDSTIVLDLTINYSTSATDTIVACGSSYTWIDGNAYTASNTTATHTLTNTAGCDSVVTLNLTLNPTSASSSTVSACGSYAWATTGVAYYASGTYKDTLVNTVGCDSIVTLNLTINQIYSLTETYTACDSFTWSDGITYTSSNTTAVQGLTSISGCDSIVSLDLTINNSNSETDNITACGSYTWIDGITYTASNNTASKTFTNATGCDSVVTLNLTLHVADTSVTRQDLTLTANASSGSFQWLDCSNNYVAIPGETSANYTVTQSGSYALEVTNNDCVDTSSCYGFTNVGVSDIQVNKDIRVYPNPTANFITIDLQKVNASKALIIIVDFAGHTVYQESIAKASSPWTKQVDMSSFASGVYFVKVAIGGEEFVYQVSRL